MPLYSTQYQFDMNDLRVWWHYSASLIALLPIDLLAGLKSNTVTCFQNRADAKLDKAKMWEVQLALPEYMIHEQFCSYNHKIKRISRKETERSGYTLHKENFTHICIYFEITFDLLNPFHRYALILIYISYLNMLCQCN